MKKDYLPIKQSQTATQEKVHLKEFWASHWNKYDRKISPESLLQDEKYIIMQRYLNSLSVNSRILDGGCGLGEWAILFAKQRFNIVGIDINWQGLIKASKWISSFGHFICADIKQIPFKDGYFDVYFSWGVFEHFEEGLRIPIAESYRILKPGGLLFLSVPYQNWRHIFRDSLVLERWDESYTLAQGYVSPMRFYQWRLRPQELRRELEMHGFRVLKIVPINKMQGIFRMMHHEFRWLKLGSFLYRFISRLLFLILPSAFVSHMLMAVAQRLEEKK